MSETNLSDVLQVRRDKLSDLCERGLDPFRLTSFDRDAACADVKARCDELDGQTVTIAGRIMAYRGKGKVAFVDLMDQSGRIQLYVRSEEIGEEFYADFKKLDIGDIIGVTGFVFRTRMGEPSIHVKSYTLLSKSLQILPEKYHGLKDTDTRYRQRYVDLIVNPEVRHTFELRSKFISYVRRFMDGRGYMEVETPVLNTIPGSAAARPFVTHHNALNIDMYMRIATELHLKRLIVGGFEKVYEIGRIFRNEGMDTRHNPEFTTIELYEAYADFNDMMDLFEDLLSGAAMELRGTYETLRHPAIAPPLSSRAQPRDPFPRDGKPVPYDGKC
ncbi:MAG: hypothetical protein IIX84_00950 [Oscillospiraceae bacterium]|nr:hypothetical protein [Oscillospiraceae bacterium]